MQKYTNTVATLTSLDFDPLSICLVREATSLILAATLSDNRAFVSWFHPEDILVVKFVQFC